MAEKKHYHRGRRKKRSAAPVKAEKNTQNVRPSKSTGDRKSTGERKSAKNRKKGKGGIISTIVLIVALAVFCFSAFQLYQIFSGYHEGKKEYDEVRELAVTGDDEEDPQEDFRVNFEELLGVNPDTVGWIRFYPEPTTINYPLVQTDNNDLYLNKTFSANENTVGAIFVNCYNNADFNDKNTIIYGHRMKDSSMFHDLEKYQDESFWKDNQYFYIYTPDGREITYHIYSAGIVKDTSDTYLTEFATDEDYQTFLENTKIAGAYDTGVEVTTDDVIVTLSTCTAASDDNRMVVRGVKESERTLE